MNRASRRIALVSALALAAAGCAGVAARPADGALDVEAAAVDRGVDPSGAGAERVAADGALDASRPGAARIPAGTALDASLPGAARIPAGTALDAVRPGARRVAAGTALDAPRAGASRLPSSPPVGDGGSGGERGAELDDDRAPSTGEVVTGVRAQVVDAARRMLGTTPRLDCSGFVLAALAEAGVTVDLRPARSRSESLYRASRPLTHPSPGDLVFFDRTRDRDRRGRRAGRNRFTHVALVEAVDGTALTLIHRGGRRVERIRMDLSRPSDPAVNDPVRVRRRRDRPGTRYLSGELFAAFGGLLPDDVTRKLQARRGRDTPVRHPARR